MSAPFTLEEALRATGGEVAAVGHCIRFAGVVTDTRALRPAELFVALRGDRHDGHAFVAEAATRGAGAVIVERLPVERVSTTVIVVPDTLAALGDLAAFHRRRVAPRVLAVTGSNGKTTTKEMLAAVCREAFGPAHVVQTQGTQNNLVGLPLTLLRLGGETKVAVLELGMNGPGEIWRLAEIAAPDVGVVTCMAAEHLEGLGSIHGVVEANTELYRRLRISAIAVFNADDARVAAAAHVFPGRIVGFGTDVQSTVRARDIEDLGLEGVRFHLGIGGDEAPVRLRLPGRHNVYNALAAAAVAHTVGVPLAAIRAGLEGFELPGMRMEIRRLSSGVTVLNDAYNANPSSMAAALATLAASRGTRRLAALGEMRELGAESEHAHRELGGVAAAADLDALFLIGPHAVAVRDGAEAAGMAAGRIVIASGHEDLAARLRAAWRPGDLILLKGSRGAAMEVVLRHLEQEPSA